MKNLSKQVENTVGKAEIARYEQFLLFPQCFQKTCFPGASKAVIVWEWVNPFWGEPTEKYEINRSIFLQDQQKSSLCCKGLNLFILKTEGFLKHCEKRRKLNAAFPTCFLLFRKQILLLYPPLIVIWMGSILTNLLF